MDTLAPDLTDNNKGFFKSPNFLPESFSIFFNSLFISFMILGFNFFLFL